MTNHELEQKLAEAVSRTVPDDLDCVLSRCGTQKGNVIQMTTRRKNPVYRTLIAACLALALIGGGSTMVYQQAFAVASVVSLDVNPSIELTVNKQEKVLSCEPLNAEARTVLSAMDSGADLKGAKLNVAVNAITGALLRSGYLDSISSAILISVEDKDQQRAAKLQQELTAEIDTVLLAQNSEAAVLSQTVQKDAALEKQAKENNISTGKASLIRQIMALNSNLTFEQLSCLSVEELKDLLQTGAPGMPIGKEAAAQAAAQYAGVTLQDVLWEADAELDETPACYEVELYIAGEELEYHIDAYTGAVLSGAPLPLSEERKEQTQNWIGEDAAMEIALRDFLSRYPELENETVRDQSVEPDKDDGVVHYDVEFDLGSFDVDYEIDAVTGAVLEWDTDYEGPPAPQVSAASQTPSDIGAERAKAIAFAHAGVSPDQISDLEVERDEDDGRQEYEIEFEVGSMEYEYTVDAFTGAVLEHETDLDD